jgi:Putative Ig domain
MERRSEWDDTIFGGGMLTARRSYRIRSRLSGRLPTLGLLCLSFVLIAGCHGGGNAITIQISPSTSQSVDEGGSISFMVFLANDIGNRGVTWKITGSSCSGSGCGTLVSATPLSVTYQAPANISAAVSATLTATSVAQSSVTSTVAISVVLAPTFSTPCVQSIATCTLTNGGNGSPYSVTLGVTGGVSPYVFSVVSGALPSCLKLNATSGQIVGTPCGSGQANFTVSLTDHTITQPGISGPSPSTQAYSIFIAPAPVLKITSAALPAGFTNAQYSATIATQGGVTPFTWTLLPGSTLPPGLALNPNTGQISGVPTAASPAGTPYSFDVQVQDSSLPSPGQVVSAMISLAISQPPALAITTTSLPAATTATAYNTSLQASGGVLPYKWTITQGLLPSGLNFASLSTGAANISGTPILATTTATSFTVQVSDSEVTPQVRTASLSITVNPGTTNGDILLQGQYSYIFRGFDTNGSVLIIGTFTADGNGDITSGTADSNREDSSHNAAVITGQPLVGSYSIGTDGRGTLEIIATNPNTSGTLVTDYNTVIESDGSLRFFQNDSTTTNTDTFATHGEGIAKLVSGSNFSTASFSGNYAFELTGRDTSDMPAALAGVVTATGSGTLLTPGTSDFNDAGKYGTQPITGSFSFGSNNRGFAQMTFEVPNTSAVTLTFVYYFVSSSDLYFIEVDTTTNAKGSIFYRLAGEMLLQQTTAPFNSSSLEGASVATGTGLTSGNASVLAGLLTATSCDGGTAATLSYDENVGGTVTSPSPSFSGTCTIGANGRAGFSNFGPRVVAAYLTGPGTGFVIGSDASVTTGLLEQQTAGAVQGGYTISAPFIGDTNVTNVLGQVSSGGTGTITGTIDEYDPPSQANPSGKPNLAQSFAATINAVSPNGRGTMTANPLVGFPTNLVFYSVSPTSSRAISVDAGGSHPEVIFFDH